MIGMATTASTSALLVIVFFIPAISSLMLSPDIFGRPSEV